MCHIKYEYSDSFFPHGDAIFEWCCRVVEWAFERFSTPFKHGITIKSNALNVLGLVCFTCSRLFIPDEQNTAKFRKTPQKNSVAVRRRT